jgi:hypothetical protein
MMKRKVIRLLACLVLALLYVFVARPSLAATVAAPTAFDRFMGLATGAGKTTVTLGSNGTPLVAPGVPTIQTDGGLPKVTATGSMVNPAGNRVAVTAVGRVPAAQIAAATGRLAVNLGLKTAAFIGAGVVLYDFAKEINFILSRNPDGTVKVEKTDPNICTVAPCFTYRHDGQNYNGVAYTTGEQPSREAACSRFIAVKNDNVNSSPFTQGYYFTGPALRGIECFADLYNKEGVFQDNLSNGIATATPTAPASSSSVPSSQQEFVDAVAAKSGWPISSKVGQVLEESASQTGVKVDAGPLTVTGPATSPGTVKNTTKADGSTVTATTTHNHTYSGDTISTATTTVVNNYNPTTNITTTETTVETPPKEDTPEDTSISDTALPDLPKLYTPKYPDGITGVWTTKKTALTSTPLANLASQLMPSVPAGGTCPVWNLPLNIGPWAYGVRNVAPACIIWDWCKVFIIAGALFLARALIFGG